MDKYPSTLHLVIYYDKTCLELDGSPWCVEFSDSEIIYRFPHFDKLQTFVWNVAGHLTTGPVSHV